MTGSGSTADGSSKVSGYPVGGADEGGAAENSHVRTLLSDPIDDDAEARGVSRARQAADRAGARAVGTSTFGRC